MAEFKKKPTIKEVASVTIELNKKVNELYHVVRDLDNLFGLYIRMNKHMNEFNEYGAKGKNPAKKGIRKFVIDETFKNKDDGVQIAGELGANY